MSFPAGYHPLEQSLNRQVLEGAAAHGHKVYLVGGYIRDALLNRFNAHNQPKDFDYAVVGGSAVKLAQQLAADLAGHFVLLDESCDTARIVLDDGTMIDLAGAVGGTLQSDLSRRDFTINAIAWDAEQPDGLIDHYQGLLDLKSLLIRAIAEANFLDDPLRLLRAYRFAATLGGTIEKQTEEMISRHAVKLNTVAPERVSYELFIIAASNRAAAVLKSMADTALLEAIFPELTATRKVTSNAYHHLGLWDHTLAVMTAVEDKAGCQAEWAREIWHTELSAGVTRLAATKIAGLLHDIGKPQTWQITPEGRHTFYEHDRLGAEMTQLIAQRMRWSRPVERFIVHLVRWHLRPGQLFHQGPPTARAVHRFYRSMAPEMPELMLLAFADLEATRGPGLEGEKHRELEKSLLELFDGFFVFKNGQQMQRRLLDGNQVMKLLKLNPGPILGEILQALDEAQALNEVSSRAEAERFVIDRFNQNKPR